MPIPAPSLIGSGSRITSILRRRSYGSQSRRGLVLTGFLIGGGASWALAKYQANRNDLNPIIVAGSALGAGLFALIRHFQTIDVDRQRRITESFSKAIEQLGSDK